MLCSLAYSQSFGSDVLIKRYNIYSFVNTSIIGAQSLRPEQKNKTCAQEMIDWWVMADRKLTVWFVSVNPAYNLYNPFLTAMLVGNAHSTVYQGCQG